MNRKFITVVLAGIIGIAVQGCTTIGNLGMIVKSSSNPMEKSKAKTYKDLGNADGKACRVLIAGVIPMGNADISKATDKALKKNNGDALINVTTANSLYLFIPIYSLVTVTCTSVKGTAIKWLEGEAPAK